MKTKLVLILAVASLLGAGVMWSAQHQSQSTAAGNRKLLFYSCPMHPSVKADKPGDCSICGMKLQPVYADASGTNAVPVQPSCGSGCCGGS
jgi:Cu(I)/Ag(I) efflux system membrane fusion protein